MTDVPDSVYREANLMDAWLVVKDLNDELGALLFPDNEGTDDHPDVTDDRERF